MVGDRNCIIAVCSSFVYSSGTKNIKINNIRLKVLEVRQ